jgi:hypothetical protein
MAQPESGAYGALGPPGAPGMGPAMSQDEGTRLDGVWPLELWIPGRLEGPGRRGSTHWRIEAGYRKRWKLAVWGTVQRALWRRVIDPRAPKRIHFHAVVGGPWDDDNLPYGCKGARDGLIKAGLIQDDRRSAGHVFTYSQETRRDRARWGLRIRVEEGPLSAKHPSAPQVLPTSRHGASSRHEATIGTENGLTWCGLPLTSPRLTAWLTPSLTVPPPCGWPR